MSKEYKDLCNWVIKQAKAAGASDCKVSISKERFVDINYRKKKPETIKEASTQGLSLEIFMNGRYSSQSTPDLRKSTLETFIAKGCENTQFIEEDPFRSLPEKKYIEGKQEIDLYLYDNAVPELTTEKQHQLAKEIEAACLDRGADKAISVEAGVNFSERENTIIATNGFEDFTRTTDCNVGASMTAKGEGDRKPNGYYWVGGRHLSDLPEAQFIGKTAADRTLQLIGGKKLETETLPVIIENRTVGRVLWGFLSALNGQNIQQQRSFLADKKGELITSDKLSIVDNPLLVGGRNSKLVDYDGMPTKERKVITNGVIDSYYFDWYYSRKMGVEPTTGSFSNLLFNQGNKNLEQLMQSAGRGILITGFIGGNSNSTTGDFSIGIIGQLFENGVPVQAISEMNIADNHLEFWKKLVDTGNDPWKYGGWQTPSLLFDDIVVAGK